MVSPAPSSPLPVSQPPTWSRRDAPVEAWVPPGCLEGGQEARLKVRTNGAKTLGPGLTSSRQEGAVILRRQQGPGWETWRPQTPLWSQQESQIPPGPRLVFEK